MERHSQLVQKLLEKTKYKTISWQEGAGNGNFVVSFSSGSIRLYSIEDDEVGTDYFIDVINGTGSTVETFSDVDVDKALENPVLPGKGRAIYVAMKELYELARRDALGSDKVISSILDELDLPF